MRLWSIHPKYLDTKGLLAAWREGLLAKKVLEGNTKGYRNHPQLTRFKSAPDPIATINAYLCEIANEAHRRNYAFDRTKLIQCTVSPLQVTHSQIDYEWAHLLKKLKHRDPARYAALSQLSPAPHPLFTVTHGPIEPWEVVLEPEQEA